MEQIGIVALLSVQRSSLKVGERPRRHYDPAPLCSVSSLIFSPDGVMGRTEAGEEIVDVHHRRHPSSKNADGVNGVSIGFTAHYEAMRARFGDRLSDGIAGENVLLRTDRQFTEEDLAAGLLLEAPDGTHVPLARIVVAEPCVEFSRYALRHPDDAPSNEAVVQALTFLRNGRRGFYATYDGPPATVHLGSRAFLP